MNRIVAQLALIGSLAPRQRAIVTREQVQPLFTSWGAFIEFATQRGCLVFRDLDAPDRAEVLRVC